MLPSNRPNPSLPQPYSSQAQGGDRVSLGWAMCVPPLTPKPTHLGAARAGDSSQALDPLNSSPRHCAQHPTLPPHASSPQPKPTLAHRCACPLAAVGRWQHTATEFVPRTHQQLLATTHATQPACAACEVKAVTVLVWPLCAGLPSNR